jgi:hypothetical protein
VYIRRKEIALARVIAWKIITKSRKTSIVYSSFLLTNILKHLSSNWLGSTVDVELKVVK